MDPAEFDKVSAEEFKKVRDRLSPELKNVALLIEHEGDLLGSYHGVPKTERGDGYGNLGTLPDTITLYYHPLLREGESLYREGGAPTLAEGVRRAIHETLWHEIGHHYGMSEGEVREREGEGTNEFR